MTDTLPDRLSTDPESPFYDADILARNVGVRFKGEDKTNVDEYCVSEGWVRLAVGNSRDRKDALRSYRNSWRGDDYPGLKCAFGRDCTPYRPPR